MTDETRKPRSSFTVLTGERMERAKPSGKLAVAGSIAIIEAEVEIGFDEYLGMITIGSLSIRLNAPHPAFKADESFVVERNDDDTPVSVVVRDKTDPLRFHIKTATEGNVYSSLGTALIEGLEAINIAGADRLVKRVNAEIDSVEKRGVTYEKVRIPLTTPARTR